MSSLLLETFATPGDITSQLPSLLESMQRAPVVGGVVMATDWVVPFITLAQPDKAIPNAAMAAIAPNFMISPLAETKKFADHRGEQVVAQRRVRSAISLISRRDPVSEALTHAQPPPCDRSAATHA